MEEHRSQRSSARLNGEHYGSQACSDAEIITAESLQIPCTALEGSLGAGMYLLRNDRIGIEDYQLQFSSLTTRSRAQNWWQRYFQKSKVLLLLTMEERVSPISNPLGPTNIRTTWKWNFVCIHVQSFSTSIPAPTLSSPSCAQPFTRLADSSI